MFYKLKDEEWQLLRYCYDYFFDRLSPVVKVKVSRLLSILETDKIIKTREQANDICFLLAVVMKENEIDTLEGSDGQQPKKKQSKRIITETYDPKFIAALIESLRLFLNRNFQEPEKSKDAQQNQSL